MHHDVLRVHTRHREDNAQDASTYDEIFGAGAVKRESNRVAASDKGDKCSEGTLEERSLHAEAATEGDIAQGSPNATEGQEARELRELIDRTRREMSSSLASTSLASAASASGEPTPSDAQALAGGAAIAASRGEPTLTHKRLRHDGSGEAGELGEMRAALLDARREHQGALESGNGKMWHRSAEERALLLRRQRRHRVVGATVRHDCAGTNAGGCLSVSRSVAMSYAREKQEEQRKEKKKLEQCARERSDYLAEKERRLQVCVRVREREGALMQPLGALSCCSVCCCLSAFFPPMHVLVGGGRGKCLVLTQAVIARQEEMASSSSAPELAACR